MQVDKKLIFNSSMPKAGSEVLQCIIHQNPRIYGSVTSPLLEYQFAARGNYDLAEVKSQDSKLMQKAFISMCAGMAQSYYQPITDRPIICDKNRGWLHYHNWVEQWNPETKMICMVRDLRSIIASFERVYRSNRHSPQGIDSPQQLQNMTLEQRVDYWLNTQPVGLALMRTYDAFQQKNSDKIHFVKYEELCKNPDQEMRAIYDYIGEPYFKHDFNNIEKKVHEDDSHFGIFGKHTIKPNIKEERPKSWADVLPEQVASSIRDKARWYFDTFGY
jgi:sulfotransferase